MRALSLRIRESFWFLPAVMGIGAIVLAQVLVTIDDALVRRGTSISFLDTLSASGGQTILTTIGTAMLTVAGTAFSITISVLATTSSTYGPRLVRNFMADRANQYVLASFTSTFLYSLVVLRTVHTAVEDGDPFVPVIAIHVAVLIGILDVAVLVFFIHHIASSTQVTSLQKQVQTDLVAAVDLVYRSGDAPDAVIGAVEPARGPRTEVVAASDGYVQSVDWARLVRWAEGSGRRVEMVQMPGDHVIDGDVLVRVVSDGGEAVELGDDDRRSIRAAVLLGDARTPYQDVRFALQQLVEIAVRGLASGSNDPYTAVSALDLSASALVPVWRDRVAVTGYRIDGGPVRVVPCWPTPDDLVAGVFEGVRTYGSEQPIVLRAAIRLVERLDRAAAPERSGLLSDTGDILRHLESTAPTA